MNCFENVTMPSCVWFESAGKRNILASMLSGLLFFTGWWIIIDAAAVANGNEKGELPNAAHVCGVMATISLIIVNSISNAHVRGETYTGGCMGPFSARIWLFLGFMIGFASLIAATGILFLKYIKAGNNIPTWPGVSLLMQNVFILAGSLVFKFGRKEDVWS